ncbi:MAG: hypothetical protein NC489_16460 [Ruminococcus flavefaciens]|nr:hypothetical protein [Ruminococcus flavefaciens]
MEREEKKGRKKWIIACTAVLLTLGILAAVLFARYWPVYRDAGFLAGHLELSRFTYEMEVRLDPEELEEETVKLLDTLGELTGTERESMYRLLVRGSVDGDKIHASVYPEGRREPLIELYLSEGEDVVNCAMLYQAVRSHYTEGNVLAAFLFPEWNDHEFVSLEQMEQILELDLGKIKNFRLSLSDRKLTVGEYFALLAISEREKTGGDGRIYAVSTRKTDSSGKGTESAQGSGTGESSGGIPALEARLEFDRTSPVIELSVSADNPSELLEGLPERLSGLIGADAEKYRAIKEVSLTLTVGEGVRLEMPQDLISQRAVDIIAGIRSVIREISGK